MDRIPVMSSAVRSIGYDARTSTLEVEFRSGRVYRYVAVPPEVRDEILSAPSIGTFLNTEIKGRFGYVRVA